MDLTTAEILWDASLVILGGAGVVLFNYLRKRLAILRWQATHFLIAQAAPNAVFGDLQITFNNVECANIYGTRVTISNDSGKDLTDFDISLRFRTTDIVVYENVWVDGTAWALPWTDSFTRRVEGTQAARDNPDDATEAERRLANNLNRHRDFTVRALNRGGTISADFLVHTEEGQPYVEVMSDSAGVKVLPKPHIPPMRNEYWGVSAMHGARLGLVLNALLVALLYQFVSPPWLMVVIAMVAIVLSVYVGAITIRVFRGVFGIFR